jgi:hypothetical protein
MIKRYFITAAIILGPFSQTSWSQITDKPFDIYVGAGLSLPVSNSEDLTEVYKTGFHGMGGIGFNINRFIETVLKVEYHTLARDWSYPAAPGGAGGTLQAMFGGADMKFSPRSMGAPALPFLFGGVGVAIFSVSELSGATAFTFVPEDDSKLYFDFGAGFEFVTSEDLTLFVQGSYVTVAFDEQNRAFVPITVGVKF